MNHNIKINPLDVLDIRKVDHLPDHYVFSNIFITFGKNFYEIERWIKNNTQGKYFIGNNVWLGDDNKIVSGICVGFEKSSEHTLFMLACPFVR